MDSTKEYNSIYRALVVENKDKEKRGQVKVWIPDLMPKVAEDEGLWAFPANNPIGGRNNEYDSDHVYMGSSYVPGKGSWTWIFFECGNPNRPYYFGALEPGNTKVLPECQLGSEHQNKWVIFKSREGRCVVISDDPDDRRVEITGKKRNISNKPTGNTDSVYTIDENQTSILLDERDGKEKVLIRTHKGDYLHIDIDEQKLQSYFKNDMLLQTDGSFHLSVAKNILIESKESTNITCSEYNLKTEGDVNITCGGNYNLEAKSSLNIKSGSSMLLESGSGYSLKSGGAQNYIAASALNVQSSSESHQTGLFAVDGTIALNQGASSPASATSPQSPSSPDTPDKPEGERDT